MDLTGDLQKNIIGFGAVILTVVVLSIILVNFKDTNGVTAEINTTIDTAVTGFQEPANWVDIVVISVIGIGILGLFMYLLKKKLD